MKGWVYVISNKAMPGLVKVGFSMKAPQLRASELNHTGAPHAYDVEYECLIDNPRTIEQLTHQHLRPQREGKEWFRCPAAKAVAAIQIVAGGRQEAEKFQGVERAEAERQRKIDEAQRKQQETEEKKREEIRTRYNRLLSEQAASAPYIFFLFIAFFPVIFFMEPRKGASWLFTVLIAALVAFFAKEYVTERKKKSPAYQNLTRERDAAIQSIDRNDSSRTGTSGMSQAQNKPPAVENTMRIIHTFHPSRGNEISPSAVREFSENFVTRIEGETTIFRCPKCSQKLTAPSHKQLNISCQKCSNKFQIHT